MLSASKNKEQAVIVQINFSDHLAKDDLEEFKELAISAGADPVAVITGSRNTPEPKYYVGSGKAEEIKSAVSFHKANLVLVNHPLSPAQERNLEKLCQCRVLDRTSLILDIFAQRARTFEGKLQVELAQLQHLSTRLVRGWTHLERQKGGIGLRGPGETQLETDRRLIRARVTTISKRLEKVRQVRYEGSKARRKSLIPTVSLVGYTNAGKSTLFNLLTGSEVFVADQLFATLDPTLRKIKLPNATNVIVADTVGFIRHLPHDLVDAFRATLEETREANLLLHVVDASSEKRQENALHVIEVLQEIGADKIPLLQIYNKIDLLSSCEPRVDRNEEGKPFRVWLSAVTGAGINLLSDVLVELLAETIVERTLRLTPNQGRLRAIFYEQQTVLSEQLDADGNWILVVRLPEAFLNQLLEEEPTK